MPVEGLVKLRSCTVVSEAFPRAYVAGQFATEVIVKGPLRQASKEGPLQCSEGSPHPTAQWRAALPPGWIPMATVVPVLPSPSNSRPPPSGPSRPGQSVPLGRAHDDQLRLISPRLHPRGLGCQQPGSLGGPDPWQRQVHVPRGGLGSAARRRGETPDQPPPPGDSSRRLRRGSQLFPRRWRRAAAHPRLGATSATSAERRVLHGP